MKRSRFSTIWMSALVWAAAVVTGHAQFSIDWYSIDGGGGTSSGGSYTLTGTIGQPDAGKSSGGSYELTGGFMSIVTAIQTPGAPLLSVVRNGNNVVVSWPDPSTGFSLEETTALADPPTATVWTATSATPAMVDGTLQVTIPAPVGKKYYRLKKP